MPELTRHPPGGYADSEDGAGVAEPLTCPACRTGQFRRRGDPLCPPCSHAALKVAPSPLWVLDSPLLRRALASVNMPAVVAIVRSACGLSQRDLAEVARWSAAALSYYERGRRDAIFDVRVLLKFADAVGMPRAALLALVSGNPATATSNDWQSADTLSATAPGLIAGIARPPVGDAHLRYWKACTDALHERDRQAGGTSLLRPALLLWRQVGGAIPRPGCEGARSTEFAETAAGIALYAGQAALDSGSLVLARSLLSCAHEFAAGAVNPLFSAQLLLAQSLLRAETARADGSREPARQALHLAREAIEEARYEPVPQLHALTAIRHAQAAALLGDKPVFDAAIARAKRELDRPGPDSVGVPVWLEHIGPVNITAAEAAGALDLGDTHRGAELYREALDMARCPRERLLFASGLAHALTLTGDREEAVTVALSIALPVLDSGVSLARCLDQLRHAAISAGAVRGTLELRERIDEAQRALPRVPGRETGTAAVTLATLASMPA